MLVAAILLTAVSVWCLVATPNPKHDPQFLAFSRGALAAVMAITWVRLLGGW